MDLPLEEAIRTARSSPAAYVLRHFPRGDSAFKLTGSNRFFDQRADHVPIARLRIRDGVRDADEPARAGINIMEQFLDNVRDVVAERLARFVQQGNLTICRFPLQLERRPPFLV